MSAVLMNQETAMRRRAASMKQFKPHATPDRQVKKTFTLNKRSSQIEGTQSNFFSIFADKKRSKITEDPELAMDLLDQQIAKIRSTLDTMRMEDKSIGERVARVTAAVDAATTTSRNPSISSSLEKIQERTCESSTKTPLSGSTSSLSTCDSKRDSGFVYDPNFEMCDPQKNCMPNNCRLSPSKKARSTSAIDFIKNNLHEDCGQRLKATSVDRLSCYSDSALLAIPGLRFR